MKKKINIKDVVLYMLFMIISVSTLALTACSENSLESTGIIDKTIQSTKVIANNVNTDIVTEESGIILETTTITNTINVDISSTTTVLSSSFVETSSKNNTELLNTTLLSLDEIALDVIRGNWDKGAERKRLLEEAGYNYEEVQTRVNQILNETKDKATTTTSVTNELEYDTVTDVIKTEIDDNKIGDTKTTVFITDSSLIDTTTTTVVITEVTIIEDSTSDTLSQEEYDLLCRLVANEYGGMTDVRERAKIVAAVFNQRERWGGTITSCIYNSCVPWGFNPNQDYYGGTYYKDMSDAVDYYLTNGTAGLYDIGYWTEGADSWWGDGRYNHFYRA